MKILPSVYLTRHGETEWSVTGRHTGRTNLPLTDQGERLGERLKGLAFTKVCTSPLQRPRRICERAGFGNVAQVDYMLVERNHDDSEGWRTAQMHAERSDRQLFQDGCPGGASPEQIGARADKAVNRLRPFDGGALIFSSGHFLRVLTARWLNHDWPIYYGRTGY